MGEQPKKKSGILSLLSDDVLGQVVKKVKNKQDRKSFSEVCKQWLRVEGLDRSKLFLYLNKPGFSLPSFTRFPNIVTLAVCDFKTHNDLGLIAQTCPKIESILFHCRDYRKCLCYTVGFSSFVLNSQVELLKKYLVCGGCGVGTEMLSPKGLCALGEGCPKLSHVEIIGPNTIDNSGVVELVQSAHNLEALVLQYTLLISDGALRGIGSSSSISILVLISCDNITDEGLSFLANGTTSKTLKKLIIECSGRSNITDTGVQILHKMCSLKHLELSFRKKMSEIIESGPEWIKITDAEVERLRNFCRFEHLCWSYWQDTSQITDIGGVGIAAIRTLKELTLNYVDVSDPTMVALAQNCLNLEILDIGGCKKVTGAGIRAFCSHKCLKSLKLDELKINLSDVEQLVLGCPSLESIVVRRDPTWDYELIQERTFKVVRFGRRYARDI